MAATLLDKWKAIMAIALDPATSKAEVAVAAAMLDRSNGDGESWMALDTIGALTGNNRSTVCRALAKHEARGRFARTAGGGRRHTTTYRAIFASAETVAPAQQKEPETIAPVQQNDVETVAPAQQFAPLNCRAGAQKLLRPCTETVAPVHPYTSYDSIHDPAEERERPSDDIDLAVALWNALAGRRNLPKVAKLTAQRRKHLGARLKDADGIDGWRAALEKIERIPGLLGENDRGWKANIDWLIKESSFTKLMEGGYDGWKPGTERKRGSIAAAVRSMMEKEGYASGDGSGNTVFDTADDVADLIDLHADGVEA